MNPIMNEIAKLLALLYTTDEALVWLYSPQATLDSQRPAEMIHNGHADKVLNALASAFNGDYI